MTAAPTLAIVKVSPLPQMVRAKENYTRASDVAELGTVITTVMHRAASRVIVVAVVSMAT